VTIQSIRRNRPLVWEDEAPVEPRLRRVEQSAPLPGRALPGKPQEMPEPEEDDDSLRTGRDFQGRDWPDGSSPQRNRNRWWRPSSKAGRISLLLATVIVLGGLAVSAYLLKSYLDRDAHFRINGAGNIGASGLTEVSRAELLPVFGEDIGRNIFYVPLAERRKQLEEIPWIEKATVMRLLPDQIRVSVVERQPVAFTRIGSQIGLVDANGVLLTMPAAMMAQRNYSFPVVTGIDAHDPPEARKARMAVYQRLLGELDANGQKLSAQISEIDLSDPDDARVLMPEQGGDILAHFGQDQFLERYQRYKAHIGEWRQKYPKLAAVDLRYDQQAVLEMAPGTNVAQAAADDQQAASANDSKTPIDQIATSGKHDEQPSVAKAPASHSRHGAKGKPGKSGAKLANGSAKTKTAAVKTKATKARTLKAKAQANKRAMAKRAALNLRPAPTVHPAAAPAGEGQ